jgi:very-short-patch-repair endonuclease
LVSRIRVDRGNTHIKQMTARSLRNNMTVAERILWSELRKGRCRGLSFRRQQVIRGFVVDFYCPTLKLIVEVDGLIHESQHAMDEDRTRALSEAGAHVIRFTNDHVVGDVESVLYQIANWRS